MSGHNSLPPTGSVEVSSTPMEGHRGADGAVSTSQSSLRPPATPQTNPQSQESATVESSRSANSQQQMTRNCRQGRSRSGAFSEASDDGRRVRYLIEQGKIAEALSVLQSNPAIFSLPDMNPLHDILPLILHSLAESYDSYGIQGNEKIYFDFYQYLHKFMTKEEQSSAQTLATMFYAACKFNQTEFGLWILEEISEKTRLSIDRLAVDRSYRYNRLRHCALHYVARNGNVKLLQHMTKFCSASPLLLESSLLMQFPQGQEGMELSSLYIAASQRHKGFVKYAIESHRHKFDDDGAINAESDASSPKASTETKLRVPAGLRQLVMCLMIHGLVALDDVPTAEWIRRECMSLDPIVLTLPMATSADGQGNLRFPPSMDKSPTGGSSTPVSLPKEDNGSQITRPNTREDKPNAKTYLLERRKQNAPSEQSTNDATNCLALHLCLYRLPPSPHQAKSVPSAATAAGISLNPSGGPEDGTPRRSAVERLREYTAEFRQEFKGATTSGRKQKNGNDQDGTEARSILHQHIYNYSYQDRPAAPHPALNMFGWLLNHFPWLSNRPFCIMTGEADQKRLEWRNAFHSACSVGCRSAAEQLLQLDPELLHRYSFSMQLQSCSVPEQPDKPEYADDIIEFHPLFITIGHCRLTGQFDFLRWLLSHYPEEIIDREVYEACQGLHVMVPDFVKDLCKNTGLSLRRMMGMPSRRGRWSSQNTSRLSSQSRTESMGGTSNIKCTSFNSNRSRSETDSTSETPIGSPDQSGVQHPTVDTQLNLNSFGTEDASDFFHDDSSQASERRTRSSRKKKSKDNEKKKSSDKNRKKGKTRHRKNKDDNQEGSEHSQQRARGDTSQSADALLMGNGSEDNDKSHCILKHSGGGNITDMSRIPSYESNISEADTSHMRAFALHEDTAKLDKKQPSVLSTINSVSPSMCGHDSQIGDEDDPRNSGADYEQGLSNSAPSLNYGQKEEVIELQDVNTNGKDRETLEEKAKHLSLTRTSKKSLEHIPQSPDRRPTDLKLKLSSAECEHSRLTEDQSYASEEEGEEVKVGSISFNDVDIIFSGTGGLEIFCGTAGRRTAAIKRVRKRFRPGWLRERIVNTMLELTEDGDNTSGARYILNYFDDAIDKKYWYLATELCETNLENGIYSLFRGTQGACSDTNGPAENLNTPSSLTLTALMNNPVELCLQLVRATAYMHDRSFIHGCLNPGNIFLKRGSIRISGFGTSLSVKNDVSLADVNCQWVAPELVQKKSPGLTDYRVDSFSVGCLIFYILSGGKHPFGGPEERTYNIENSGQPVYACLRKSWWECYMETSSRRGASYASISSIPGSHSSSNIMSHRYLYSACHLVRSLIECTPEQRLTLHNALIHPLFWSSRQQVETIAAFSDVTKQLYGILPSWESSKAIQRLEKAFRQFEGSREENLNWIAKLKRNDDESNRRWESIYEKDNSSSEWKAPEEYFKMYTARDRQLHALGLCRAVRNIAYAHAVEYVSAGLFESVEKARAYFLHSFSWLVVEIYDIISSRVDPQLSQELSNLLPKKSQ